MMLKIVELVNYFWLRLAWETGWRVNSEILTREWKHVDFQRQIIRLEPQETKNGKAREFFFTDNLKRILKKQRVEYERLRRQKRIFCQLIFNC
jgi:integrase